MIARSVRSRNWVFTINNFTEEDENMVVMLADREDVYRVIAEHEIGEMGTCHIQGYVSFTRIINRSWLENWLGGRAWIDVARGGWRQNWAYCSKEGTVIVEKKGMDEFVQCEEYVSTRVSTAAIDACKTMDPFEFQDTFPNVWFYHRSKIINMMMDFAMTKRKDWDGDLKCKNYWIWGQPGVGKSKWASSRLPINYQYKKNTNKWWDGYSVIMHKLIIIEDYPCLPAGNCLVQHLKIWGDRYCFEGEVKTAHVFVQPGRFFLVVTSNYPINMCFENPVDIEAIKRRFTEIEMTEDNRALLSAGEFNLDILDS